ncbi:MAG: hypothetical protein U9N82_06705 [Thermodesulfobacteriota bacterium]|nr:hypothetical protein [Thermodesulfobacteriota bacterium]
MELYMDWFFSIIRVAGASFPVSSSLVQLQSEIDSKALLERVQKLEDPVSVLHDDVPALAKAIYHKLKSQDSTKLLFDDEFYSKYSRSLAILETQGFIKGRHAVGDKYMSDIRLCDPSFIMYLCAIGEDKSRMEDLLKIVDSCEVGKWLDGKHIKSDIELPLPVIKAVFDIYESKGYGQCSKTIGAVRYMGKA